MKSIIVVGDGLAGSVLSLMLKRQGYQVTLIGEPSLSACSRVAAGIWNPLVFKRMTLSWMVKELLPVLKEFYSYGEKVSGRKFLQVRQSIRAFTEDQEKELWLNKSRNELCEFAESKIQDGQPEGFQMCRIPNGYAHILQSGNLNIPVFLEAVAQNLNDCYLREKFEFSEIRLLSEGIRYKQLEADAMVFCEGYLVKNNPYFKWIPLKPAKGEVLHLHLSAPGFRNGLFHRNGFLMDLEPGLYLTGATYNWEDLNDEVTEGAKRELEQKLQAMLSCDYKIEKLLAGVRPTSIDRRPIVGAHPKHKQLFVFNGLGTKGVMLAPWLALKFVHFLQQTNKLPRETNVARFYHLYADENT